MARSLADFLTDFGSPDPVSPPALVAPVATIGFAPEVVERRIREAVEAAESAMAERHAREKEALRAELAAAHAAELAQLAETTNQHNAALIERGLEAVHETVVERTQVAVARILGLALTEQMQARALDHLAATLRSALADKTVMRLRITGPEALHAALVERLGDAAPAIMFTPSNALDLTVAMDDTLYATRLADWSAELAAVLA
jgi:hypothetical protein